MPIRVRVESVAGRRTRFYDAGEGAALLLVHGAGASADTWIRNLDGLSAFRRVIAPDLLSHGFSDYVAPDGRPPQLTQAEHIIGLADVLGLDRFAIVGSSFGGLVAALAMLHAPERVTHLVLVGTASVFHPPEAQRETLAGVGANQAPAYLDPTLDALRGRNAGSNFDRTDGFPEILLVQAAYLALGRHAQGFADTLAGLVASAGDPGSRVYHRLHELTAPTLVIQGREDPRVRLEHVLEGLAHLPCAELEVFEQCGHKPFAEHPLRFNQRLLAFLARAPK